MINIYIQRKLYQQRVEEEQRLWENDTRIKRCTYPTCSWGTNISGEVDCPRCGTALIVVKEN